MVQIIYLKEYNRSDAENLKSRRTFYTNQSWLSAKLLSFINFGDDKQSAKGYLLGMYKGIVCNSNDFKKI